MISYYPMHEVNFLPISVNLFTALFSKDVVQVKDLIPLQGITSINIDDYCYYDIDLLEQAFDCEFISPPDNVKDEDDFYKWIMEVKL